MKLGDIIIAAKQRRASDVHLEPGLPVTVRISSNLLMDGEALSSEDLSTMARELVGESQWPDFRQRELGRHTFSMQQALNDAMREDPDVLVVGEMREPETMRLTLNASEPGTWCLPPSIPPRPPRPCKG